MSEAQVISVNPGKKTLGELMSSDSLARISRCISAPGTVGRQAKKRGSLLKGLLNITLGINDRTTSAGSGRLLCARVLCGTALIFSQLLPMHPSAILSLDFSIESIVICAIGVSMVFGFATRIVAVCGFGLAAWSFAEGLIADNMSMDGLWIGLLIGFFAIMGPGIYSVDQLMRKGILMAHTKRVRRRRKAQKTRNESLSESDAIHYGAYASIERRIGS